MKGRDPIDADLFSLTPLIVCVCALEEALFQVGSKGGGKMGVSPFLYVDTCPIGGLDDVLGFEPTAG